MEFVPECQYCGSIHKGICTRVKSVEYNPDGTIKKVEFHNSYAMPVVVSPAWEPPWKITSGISHEPTK